MVKYNDQAGTRLNESMIKPVCFCTGCSDQFVVVTEAT